MLRRLTIENYALIESLELELDENLNIITGETGAGKSILLGALALLLGGKCDSATIKEGGCRCFIEAQFDLSRLDLRSYFERRDWEYDRELILRRVVSPSGKSRAFLNDMPIAVAELKELGSRLIDIHSQHQNLILSDEAFRIEALDVIAEAKGQYNIYKGAYRHLTTTRATLEELRRSEAEARRNKEWLEHQLEELTAAALVEGEQELLEEQINILENADQISGALTLFDERMQRDEVGVLSQLKSSEHELSQISRTYSAAGEYLERLRSVIAELKDLSATIALEAEGVESDPQRLMKLSDRLDVLYTLQQKHRTRDLAELITLREEYAERMQLITDGQEQILKLESELTTAEQQARAEAKVLSTMRNSACAQFESGVTQLLEKLGMEGVQFTIELTDLDELTTSGGDKVRYLFSSVSSRAPQPIERIASGGELSRVMLSIKALLSRSMELPTIIFDEIDTGVSGRIADAMGEIIYSLARTMQVIDITHLPQVASKGEAHFVVYKAEGRTQIRRLDAEERVEQIATMLSGEMITSAAKEQAKILLKL